MSHELPPPWALCFGWAVFHFLWQACVAAGGLWLARRLLRDASPRGRYACSWLALALCVLLPCITVARFLKGVSDDGSVRTMERPPVLAQLGSLTIRAEPWSIPAVSWRLTEAESRTVAVVFPILALLWVGGSALLLARFRRGWSLMLGQIGSATDAPAAVAAQLRDAAEKTGLSRCPPCKQSPLIDAPMVAGVLAPAVIVPAGFLEDFTAEQRELLLAHELAHIRRGDPWHNAAQCLMETVVFWHPAALWISRCARHEREMCCDEMAAAATGRPRVLAEALSRLAAAGVPASCLALAANRGSLLARVLALLSGAFPVSLRWPRLCFALLTLPLVLLAAFHANVYSDAIPAKPRAAGAGLSSR